MTKVAELQIEIAANVARLTSDFGRAKEEVNRSMGHIQRTVREQLDGVKESLKSMKEMAEAMGIAMLAEHLVEAAKSAAEFGNRIEHAAQQTGMSAESLQGLSFAARMSDVDFQSLSVGLEHLSRAMLQTRQGSLQSASAFRSVGLSAQQLQSMSLDEVLAHVADRFHATRDGAAKTALAMQLFGRSGAELIPLLDRGSEGIDALKAKAKALGIVMSSDAVRQSAEFADKLKEISAQGQALTRNLMGELMPAMNRIVDAFLAGSSDGGVLKEMFRQIGEGAVWVTGFIAKLSATVEALGKTIAMVAAVVSHPLSAKSIFEAWKEDVDALQTRTNRFLATLDRASVASSPSESEGATGTGALAVYQTSHRHRGGAGGSGAGRSHLSEYEQRLANAKVYYQETHDLREYSKAQEIRYWQDILETEKLSANDRLAIERRVSSLRLAQMRQDASDRQKLAEEAIQASRDRALGEVALDEQKAQTLLKSGQITHDQLLQMQQTYQDEKYQIEVQAQQKRIALLQGDPNHDPVALQRQLDQLASIEQKHALDMEKLHTRAATNSVAAWQKAFAPITQAFDTTIKGMIMGTTTWQKGMTNLLDSVVAEFVGAGVRMVTQWAANEMARTAATLTGTATRTAAEQSANASGLASSALTVVKAIMNDAAKVFSGVWAALSGIPYVGPALAAASAPAAMATVAGVAGSVASSAGGAWQIPADRLNFVHRNETILPADKAAGLDRLISGGGGGTVHIHARSDADVVRVGDLQTLLRRMGRNFVPVVRHP
jgi:hypothetical protein